MKILVVDDSIVFRSAITQALQTVPDLDVFKTAVNGKLALDILRLHPDIDLITLDMEMPVMDGLETIREIRKVNHDVTIIVFSSLTTRGAEKTIEALNAGADDYLAKREGMDSIKEELLPKVMAFKDRKIKRSEIVAKKTEKKPLTVSNNDMPVKPKIILIGSSTGGPDALTTVFKSITEKVTVPMLLVQHMLPMFTEKLAAALTKLSPVVVREAKDGDRPEPGVCLLAPGDYHMTLAKDGTIRLNQNEKNCFVRPSVNVLLESIAQNYDKQVLNIVMTGMGEDGAIGTKKLTEKGSAYTYIQDKESCIVWGMPGAVHRTIGDHAKIVSLDQIGPLINTVSKRI